MEIFESAFLTTFINWLLLLLCLSAVWFYCYAIYAAIAHTRNLYLKNANFHPPITILKPICGLDGDAYENLATFCRQKYPTYQVIFSVRNLQDSGLEVVKQIIQDFPQLDIQLVVSDLTIGTNFKVNNLANAAARAKYEILLIADSDIRVGTDYLQRVIQPLQNKSVGVVTCLYRSLAQGWVTTLEALGTATEFHAGVLVGKQLEGMKFALGATILIRKQVLQAIGGFVAIADYLEDDFQLGYLPTQAGYKVVLSDYVVEHVLATSTLANSIRRQIRWACGTRVSRPWGYLGLIFTYGTVTSLLLLIVTKGAILSWTVLIITWMVRLVMGWVVGVKILKDPVAKKFLWLIPLRDCQSFAIWCYGFINSTIEWRGRRLKLIKSGKLSEIKVSPHCMTTTNS